ncbi:hypothetical protein BLNAU_25141 [Blattamonas nauphoetae]|uniref:DUF427 domain-containing protein n=1 Tax=Blattamonas nauphoetae TaxID=2049346 RepID=A0ABQ9WN85_9EUKA|nr:hypothetical protein BLNAU_25141 [Blattamonas nauphoetae]
MSRTLVDSERVVVAFPDQQRTSLLPFSEQAQHCPFTGTAHISPQFPQQSSAAFAAAFPVISSSTITIRESAVQ